mgnify:CR=1 FL=1
MNIKFCKKCTMQFEIADVPPEHVIFGTTHCLAPKCGLCFWHWLTAENKVKTLVSAEDTNHHNLRPWAVAGPLTPYEGEQ